MRFSRVSSVFTFPITGTVRPPDISYLNASFIDPSAPYLNPSLPNSHSTLFPRYLPPGPYLPNPPWPIPKPGNIGCLLIDDGAYTLDVGVALLALQAKGSEPCRIEGDVIATNTMERRCKTLHVEGSAAMSICGPAGWGYTCAEAARYFERIYVPCRLYVNESWRLTGHLTMADGGWLTILPAGRV